MTGAEVRKARLRLGMTHADLAKAAGVPLTALVYFERTGHLATPRQGNQDRLEAIRLALDVVGLTEEDVPMPKDRTEEPFDGEA